MHKFEERTAMFVPHFLLYKNGSDSSARAMTVPKSLPNSLGEGDLVSGRGGEHIIKKSVYSLCSNNILSPPTKSQAVCPPPISGRGGAEGSDPSLQFRCTLIPHSWLLNDTTRYCGSFFAKHRGKACSQKIFKIVIFHGFCPQTASIRSFLQQHKTTKKESKNLKNVIKPSFFE